MKHRSTGPSRPQLDVNGVLLVDKPAGCTSHDVVARVRRTFGIRKVGHGGTLDPLATGLLILLLGRGTKLSQRIMAGDKTYEGALHLGVLTDSQDGDGKVIEERDAGQVTLDALREQMSTFLGDQMQTPPMLSAIKQGGVPLYKLARKGKVVEREARLIHIFEFSLLDYTPPMVSFRLRCTKGTYVRTIAADLGEQLGCGAHMASLRRTASGAFRIEDALSLDDLCAIPPEELMHRALPVYHPSLAQPHRG